MFEWYLVIPLGNFLLGSKFRESTRSRETEIEHNQISKWGLYSSTVRSFLISDDHLFIFLFQFSALSIVSTFSFFSVTIQHFSFSITIHHMTVTTSSFTNVHQNPFRVQHGLLLRCHYEMLLTSLHQFRS